MSKPIQIDLPHRLGRAEARRRIAANVHKLADHVPGGSAKVEPRWDGDRLDLAVAALGQSVEAVIEVEESFVRCRIVLPLMLAMFARPIEAMLKARGPELLEDQRAKR